MEEVIFYRDMGHHKGNTLNIEYKYMSGIDKTSEQKKLEHRVLVFPQAKVISLHFMSTTKAKLYLVWSPLQYSYLRYSIKKKNSEFVSKYNAPV